MYTHLGLMGNEGFAGRLLLETKSSIARFPTLGNAIHEMAAPWHREGLLAQTFVLMRPSILRLSMKRLKFRTSFNLPDYGRF
jgi:hypothetical protein